MNNKALAKRISRELFRLGDEPRSKCRRIEFKGGEWHNGTERAQGGMIESAFAQWLFDRLPVGKK